MADTITPQDGTNPEGTTEIPEVTLDGTEDVEALKVKLQEANDKLKNETEARRQLTARAKTAEEEVKKLKPTTTTTKEKEINPLDIIKGEAFKLYREGYDEDEIDLILKNGGREMLKDKNHPIALGLIAKREQRKAEEASQQAGGGGGSESIGKVTIEQMKKMKSSELEKILPHA